MSRILGSGVILGDKLKNHIAFKSNYKCGSCFNNGALWEFTYWDDAGMNTATACPHCKQVFYGLWDTEILSPSNQMLLLRAAISWKERSIRRKDG